MAVVIRLQRIGKRTQPHYRMVAIEKSRGPHGSPVEVVGHYDPKAEKESRRVQLNAERYQLWISRGAKPSPTVSSLAAKAQKLQAAAPAAAAVPPAPAVKEETPAPETAPATSPEQQ